MTDVPDVPVTHGSHALGAEGDHDGDGHGLGSHAIEHEDHDDHDDHTSHSAGGDAWVLIPLAVGLIIAIVLIAIFALDSNAPALT